MEMLIEKSRKQRACKARSADFYAYDSLQHSIADAAVFRSRRTTYTKYNYAYAAHQKPRNINLFSSRHAATTPLDTPPTPHATSLLHPYSLHPKNLKNHPIYSYTFNQLTVSYWPSRDPLGDVAFRRVYVRGKTIEERRRIAQAAIAPAYVFVDNSPVDSIDYLGLNRYITEFGPADAQGNGTIQIHVGVAVDKWKVVGGKYVKDGQVTFDFSTDPLGEGMGEEDIVDDEGDISWCNIDWWNIIASSVKGRGRVAKSDGITLKSPIPVPSSPCQDIKMLELLEKDLANPPFYSAIAFNCLFWSVGALQYGMDQPPLGKCCNPDGTIFDPYAN